jgi:hypothetical protein
MAQWYEAIHASKRYRLGTIKADVKGNEYIYLKGVASLTAGDWVVYDENFAPTRISTGLVGPVAISMGANILATTFSWFQVHGVNLIAKTDTVAADKPLYIDGTTGRADDAVVNGDLIYGAISQTADTTNVCTVYLHYPFTTAVVIET